MREAMHQRPRSARAELLLFGLVGVLAAPLVPAVLYAAWGPPWGSVAWWTVGCHARSSLACFSAGLRHAKSTPPEPAKAALLYARGCDLDDDGSCNNLGVCYEFGDGVPADKTRALTLYEKACRLDGRKGCSNVGRAYSPGGIAPREDRAKADAAFRRACELGEEDACKRVRGTAL